MSGADWPLVIRASYMTSIYVEREYSYFQARRRRYTCCMKITKLTTYRVPPRWMLLKIETDEGVFGWGEPVIEGRARTVETAVQEMEPDLVRRDRWL